MGHLQSYLDEFVFRFNRRTSRSRGLLLYRVLELAVGHEPVRYRELVAIGHLPVRPVRARFQARVRARASAASSPCGRADP